MRRTWSMLALLCVMGLVASACSSNKDTGFPPINTVSPSATAAPCGTPTTPTAYTGSPIDVCDNWYSPVQVKVTRGQQISWSVTGSAPHSVTFDDGKFDSNPSCSANNFGGCTTPGASFNFTVNLPPGKYHYYCKIHGFKGLDQGMYGYIIVT